MRRERRRGVVAARALITMFEFGGDVMKRYWLVALAALCTSFAVPDAGAAEGADWASFGRDPGGSQHSPLDQINLKNVKQLRRVWTHRSGDFIDASYPKGTVLQTIALHANGTLYICTPFGRVFALDPATGRITDPESEHRGEALAGRVLMLAATRGSSSSSSVLLELVAAGIGPAAIVLGEVDAILGIGILVARELGHRGPPLLRLDPSRQAEF
ncbi:MAG: DUF126 domain-containing protein, partial [Gammaproteobacteria bacterium]|nr:DUF126 domain-containing protein [Gammaproteobacteria bacterium]